MDQSLFLWVKTMVIEPIQNIMPNEVTQESSNQASTKRLVYLLVGHLLVGLGFIGMLLPVMPTTIFWIGAAACYARSSPERYRRLIGSGKVGVAVSHYLDHGVISTKGKKAALIGMTISAVLIVVSPLGYLPTVLALAGIGIGALYVSTRPNEVPVDIKQS